MDKTRILNTVVIVGALGAILAALHATTNNNAVVQERERCYGVVKAGHNDCANSKHSCVSKANANGSSAEWVMLPKGICRKLVGGSLSEVKKQE